MTLQEEDQEESENPHPPTNTNHIIPPAAMDSIAGFVHESLQEDNSETVNEEVVLEEERDDNEETTDDDTIPQLITAIHNFFQFTTPQQWASHVIECAHNAMVLMNIKKLEKGSTSSELKIKSLKQRYFTMDSNKPMPASAMKKATYCFIPMAYILPMLNTTP